MQRVRLMFCLLISSLVVMLIALRSLGASALSFDFAGDDSGLKGPGVAGLSGSPIDLGRASVAQAEEPLVHTPDAHGRDPLAANSAWFREFKRDISNDSADAHSDQMLARLRKANGTISAEWSGPWTPADWNWYTFPFQVVSDSVAPLTVPGVWQYNPSSNGPHMLPPEPVDYEGRRQTTYPTVNMDADSFARGFSGRRRQQRQPLQSKQSTDSVCVGSHQ